MQISTILLVGLLAMALPSTGLAASARCVVVKAEGTILTLDCGKRAGGFPSGSKVKIKTDRDKG